MVEKQEKITCIGISYIEPILRLFKDLNSFEFSGYSPTQVSMRENGYSCSIILLCVAMVESAINRVKCLEKENQSTIPNYIYFKNKFNNSGLSQKLTEIYILRHIIMHNHIYGINYNFDEDFQEQDISFDHLQGIRNKTFLENVNEEKKITKTLKLNINPIKVNTGDVIKVFKVLVELFKFLEEKNKSYFPLSNFPFKYNNKYLTFYEIVSDIVFGTDTEKVDIHKIATG